MAADPIKAAEELAGKTYGSAQERTAAGKKALLDGLASNGTYQNTVDMSATQAAAPQPAPAHPGDGAYPQLGAMAQQGTQQVQAMNQAALGAAAALAAQQRAQQQAASATYFDQVSAAVPIEQSRSQSEARQIMSDLIAQREAQQAAKEQAALQAQVQREQLAGAREARQAAADARNNPAANMSPNEKFELSSKMQAQAITDVVGEAHYDSASGQTIYSGPYADANGGLTGTGKAIEFMTDNPNANPAEVARRFGAPVNDVVDGTDRYFDVLAQYGYYQTFGGQRPPGFGTKLTPAPNDFLHRADLTKTVTPAAAPKATATKKSDTSLKPIDSKLVPVRSKTGAIIGYEKK